MKRLAVICVLLLLVSCGGNQPSAVSVQLSDQSSAQTAQDNETQSLSQALAELDALETPEGVDAALFRELKDELAALLADRAKHDASGRIVSQAPIGDGNRPTDLTLVDMGENEYRLLWHEVNVGDYDNNGTVGIADITPIAMHYGEEATDPNSATGLIDGYEGNGTVDIADITGIAMNFGTSIAGYNVYVEGTLQPNQGVAGDLSVMRPADPGSGRVDYGYSLTLGGLVNVTVRPADSAGAEGAESDPAELGTGDAPAAPQGLSASGSEAIGAGKILLTWTPNTEDDLKSYRLYRTDGICAYEKVATILEDTIPLMYTDTNDGILLDPDREFTYYITAVDEDGFASPPSNEAAATPYFPGSPTAPANLDATDETGPYGLAVSVSWAESTSEYLNGYELFRKVESEEDFTLLATIDTGPSPNYLDGGLEEGILYTYRARAFDTYRQRSDFSNDDASQCSPYVEVQIIAVHSPGITFNTDDTVELTADVTNQLATITWDCDSGNFLEGNEGLTVQWEAPGEVAKPMISVHATDGVSEDDATLDLIVTTLPNLGPAVDFLEASYHAPAAPYIPFFSYALNGRVTGLCFDKYC
jgi:hypothetical protein